VKSLSDALTHSDVQSERVTTFELKVECGRYECELKLTDWWGHAIEIDATPSHLTETRRFYSDLEKWAVTRSLPLPFHWWNIARHGIRYAAFWCAIYAVMSVISFASNSIDSATAESRAAELRREADTILAEGVSPENEHSAIQTMLEIQLLDEPLPKSTERFSDQSNGFLTPLTAFLILLLLSFPPRTTIAIGKGKDLIPKVRLWLRILFVLIPTFVIMGVTASALGSVIYAYLSSDWFVRDFHSDRDSLVEHHWVIPGTRTGPTIEWEVWLWDFGGQADQRLIHQLYMDQTQVAALVFDPQKPELLDVLEAWNRDLTRAATQDFKKLLVAGRTDAGGLRSVSRAQVPTYGALHRRRTENRDLAVGRAGRGLGVGVRELDSAPARADQLTRSGGDLQSAG
jgi:hypothetical protein